MLIDWISICQWRRPGAEFGGTENFADQDFRMTLFRKKLYIFTAKISDDLFLNVVYHPFLTRTTTISEKNSFITPFLLCSYFQAHPTTLFLKILEGRRMHGLFYSSLGCRQKQRYVFVFLLKSQPTCNHAQSSLFSLPSILVYFMSLNDPQWCPG